MFCSRDVCVALARLRLVSLELSEHVDVESVVPSSQPQQNSLLRSVQFVGVGWQVSVWVLPLPFYLGEGFDDGLLCWSVSLILDLGLVFFFSPTLPCGNEAHRHGGLLWVMCIPPLFGLGMVSVSEVKLKLDVISAVPLHHMVHNLLHTISAQCVSHGFCTPLRLDILRMHVGNSLPHSDFVVKKKKKNLENGHSLSLLWILSSVTWQWQGSSTCTWVKLFRRVTEFRFLKTAK